jgi:hypothetical protein
MAFGMVLHALHAMLFLSWAVFRWHFIWYGMFVVVASGLPLQAAIEPRRGSAPRRAWAVAGVGLLLGLGLVYRADHSGSPYNWRVASYEAGRWARGTTSPETVFAMHDAGVFGYVSQRRVINLDGLVNTLAYQDVLREGRLAGYLRDEGVRYLFTHELGKYEDVEDYQQTSLRFLSRLYGVFSDSISVRQVDEAYRGRVYSAGEHRVAFVIWDLEREKP